MTQVLQRMPTIIHYTGHGVIHDGGQESLVLWCDNPTPGQPEYHAAYFGRREILALKAALGDRKVLESGSLVVLNSCWTGRMRAFGGQREDLAVLFMDEGAEAVIASPLPVMDSVGAEFGRLLYEEAFASSEGMAETFRIVRSIVERSMRSSKERPEDWDCWTTWTLLAYHGNPYARLPHVPADEKVPCRPKAGLLSQIATCFGLRSSSEAEEALARLLNPG